MRKLTIGFPTYDDYDGLYFTIQSIRMHHKEILNDVEFVIVDNNPTGDAGKAIRKLTDWIKEPIQYLPFTKYRATTIKNKIFDLAETPYVLCMDCHVLLEPNSLKKLIEYYDSDKDNGNLLQGPLIYDDFTHISTHFDLSKWGSYMWGTWATDERGTDVNNPPFEIPAQGMGVFSCRKDSWLRFNSEFRGFGPEEGYIHEKYRKHGKKVMCLPFLRWLHRFEKPYGIKYPNDLKQRFRNYMIGFHEIGLDTTDLKNEYKSIISEEEMTALEKELQQT